ncbi:MFS general substrate transporter [Aureobasidium pullulans]|nr:MFS general substrate transporter [Aureobasidium pullulans]
MSTIQKQEVFSLPTCIQIRSSVSFITLTVSLAVFTDIFLYGVVIPVIPFALTSRIGLEETEVQTWLSVLLAVYGAAMFCASPICGWATDHVRSRRTFLLIGLIALGAATSLLLVARSLALIIVARALQGISAAVAWVAGPALLADSVDPDQIGYFMGFMGDAMGLAILAAPAIGGAVFERVGYNAVFYICLGIIGLDLLFRLLVIEKKRATQIDVQQDERKPSSIYNSDTTARKPENFVPSPAQKAMFEENASVKSAVSDEDYRQSTKVKNWRGRLWPLIALLLSSRLAADLFGCLVQATLFTSFESILPLQVRETFHWGSLGAGLVFLPLTLPALISPLVGGITDRYQARWPCIVGFALAALSFVLLRLVAGDTVKDKIVLCFLVAIVGLALTLVLIPLMADIILTVNEMEATGRVGSSAAGAYGQAYALFNMSYAAGSAIGPLLAGLLKVHMGWKATTLALGCLSGVSIIPIALWVRASKPTEAVDNKSTA